MIDQNRYLEASLIGAGRGALSLAIEHPFETMKTRQQAHPTDSLREVAKKIYDHHGPKGFYSGAVPNGARLIFKQSYRWPLMLALPPYFQQKLPKEILKKYPSSTKISTGVTIASLESLFFILPLENMKVSIMTSQSRTKGLGEFFAENKGHLALTLSRGLGMTYARQITSWTSFLVSDQKFKRIAREKTGTEELSFASLFGVGLGVGCVNTAVIMPFDMIKTNLQKQKSLANERTLRLIAKVYKEVGIGGFYAGWRVKMVQYGIQASFSVSILDHLERKIAQDHTTD